MRKAVILDRRSSLVALALAGLAACGGAAGDASGPARDEDASEATIRIVGFDELERSLVDLRGEGLLLNFWAMWCGPCVAEMPELLETAHAFADEGGTVVGVSYDLMVPGADGASIEGELSSFLAKRGIDYPILVYDEADFEAVNERYQIGGAIPVTLAIDSSGQIVDRQMGAAGRERFDAMMRKALGR